ncbi:unnamed protein product [Scytosiphon promiscuus]
MGEDFGGCLAMAPLDQSIYTCLVDASTGAPWSVPSISHRGGVSESCLISVDRAGRVRFLFGTCAASQQTLLWEYYACHPPPAVKNCRGSARGELCTGKARLTHGRKIPVHYCFFLEVSTRLREPLNRMCVCILLA